MWRESAGEEEGVSGPSARSGAERRPMLRRWDEAERSMGPGRACGGGSEEEAGLGVYRGRKPESLAFNDGTGTGRASHWADGRKDHRLSWSLHSNKHQTPRTATGTPHSTPRLLVSSRLLSRAPSLSLRSPHRPWNLAHRRSTHCRVRCPPWPTRGSTRS
jgi:hypothetical protein